MNHVLSIAKKELRGYFLSPVALIFLGVFLIFTLVTVFVVKTFFARGIADIRPLFTLMPGYLIFLCAAITMRQWSEEQKMGTLEVLMTLPVKEHHLVVGKFLAALALAALALALTFGVPITVSMIGDLDWGPVLGGYLAALLLAGAYIAIGLCISSLTDSQIVALLVTSVVCGLLYIVGEDYITGLFSNRVAEILGGVGTGSRFESIRRGVIDLRDLVYYGGIIAVFLVLNTVALRAQGWSTGPRGAGQRRNAQITVGLVGANVLLLNIWLAGISGLRLDMTERGEYSISDVTKDLVGQLEEPLLIRGYFSEKTHPLLAPMVPRIRDLIEEYGEISGGRVDTDYVDPRDDESLEKEANQLFGIKSFPFRIKSRLDQSVVNSYFSILVKYGDQYEVLNFNDLIEVQANNVGDIEVKLRNPEYDLTRAIKKVAFSFQTVDAVFADLESPAEFFVFSTPETLPENYKEAPKTIEATLTKLKESSGDKFTFDFIDPSKPGAKETRETLLRKYGFKPFPTSLFSQESFYLHLLLKVGNRYERILPPDSMSEADLEKDILAAVKRAAPGFLKTVGLVKPKRESPQMPSQFGQPPPPPPEVTRAITQQLEETYTVQTVELADGQVPGDVDVLMVFGPEDFDDKQRFAIDQHLMRGGTVLVMAGKYRLDPHGGQNVRVKSVNTGLEEMLASYGVEIGDAMVLDLQNEGIPMPVERDLGGLRVRDIKYLNYPYFVNVRADGISDETPVAAGLPGLTLPWAVELTFNAAPPKEGEEEAAERTATALLKSTGNAWTTKDTQVQPNFSAYPQSGFPPPPGEDARESRTLALLVSGTFESFFKGKQDPTSENGGGTVLERSPSNARLVVIGSTAFANDLVLNLTRQASNNLQLVQNLVDWGVEDVDLLTIRSRGTYARTLAPLGTQERLKYELVNYGVALVALVLIVLLTAGRRSRSKPIELDEKTLPAASAKRAEA